MALFLLARAALAASLRRPWLCGLVASLALWGAFSAIVARAGAAGGLW